MKFFAFIFLLFFFVSAQGQNKINQKDNNGLKYGLWKYYDENNNLKAEGEFAIIKKDTIIADEDLLNLESHNGFLILNGNGSFQFNDSYQNLFSVKTGKWLYFKDSKLESQDSFNNGIHLWEKAFYPNGSLKTFYRIGLDTTLTDYYKDSVLFERRIRLNIDTINYAKSEYSVFYPKRNLCISNADLDYHSTFHFPDTIRILLKSIKNEKIHLQKLWISTSQIKLFDNFNKLIKEDFVVEPNNIFNLKIVFTPIQDSLKEYELIKFCSDSKEHDTFKIYIKTNAAHITSDNGKPIIFYKKEKNNLLIFAPFGTETQYTIKSKNTILNGYYGFEYHSVDISSIPKGKYLIDFGSCNTIGKRLLIIK